MPLLTCTEALQLIAAKVSSLPVPPVEHVPLSQAHGRVLAKAVLADRDQPPFPRSTRDGYAMRAADAGSPLTLLGTLRAGEQWTGAPMTAGETIEIMTGAPVPAGADAVVMLEHVEVESTIVTVQPGRSVQAGENVVPRGAEAQSGDQLLPAGSRLHAADIALLASVGVAQVPVFPIPTVAIVSTGDELVPVDGTPGPMQIRNSNAHGLAAMVAAHGGTAQVLPIARDTRDALRSVIAAARSADMLLLSGGVSAGKYDFVEDALLEQGAEFFFTGVAMQPGKPAVFGRIPADNMHGEQWIFGLPGNPVSTQVTGLLFAMPLLRALGGEGASGSPERTAPPPSFAEARLQQPVEVRPGLTRFLPALLTSSLTGTTVRPTGWQGSGDLNANARANCYLVVPPVATRLEVEQRVTVLLR